MHIERHASELHRASDRNSKIHAIVSVLALLVAAAGSGMSPAPLFAAYVSRTSSLIDADPPVGERAVEGAVTIDLYDRTGNWMAAATGVAIGADRVLTTRHALEGAFAAVVNIGPGGMYEVARVLFEDEATDVALLDLVRDLPDSVGILHLAADDPKQGSEVRCISLASSGRVKVLRGHVIRHDWQLGVHRLISDLEIEPGMSGSPVLDSEN